MKKTFVMAAAAVSMAAFAISCNKSEVASENIAEETAEISVRVSSRAFIGKAALSENNEQKVNNVQVFVFRGNGELDAYASSDTKADIKLSCTTGSKIVKAVVNAPDLSSISKMKDLNSSITSLTDNSLTNFVMTGSDNIDLNTDQTLTVHVSRIAARLAIEKVSVNFTSQAYRNMDMKIHRIYAVNVAGNTSYDLSAAPTVWHNQKALQTGAPDAMLMDDVADVKVTEEQPYTTGSYFYVYPNKVSEEPQDEAATARPTRIVVETILGETTYYYPITIGNIAANTKYTISNLTITRPGSLDPDIPVTSKECSFTISVNNWSEGPTENVTI